MQNNNERQSFDIDGGDYQQLNNKYEPDNTVYLNSKLEASARVSFIKKVYLVLSLQLLLTVAMCFLSYYCLPFLNFQVQNQWFMWVLLALMIIVEIIIFCVPAGRRFPLNMIALLIFTLCQGYVISYICSIVTLANSQPVVIVAAIMTLSVAIGLTLYAVFTKTDFTMLWGAVIVVSIPMLILGIMSFFTWSPFLTNLYCSLGVILFGIYLVFDTRMIVGGDRLKLSLDDYVIGALILYVDIIQIFLYLIAALGKK